tara:strand:+ start:2594 stop:2815 length:222 start_codon:yes stop_codon:yes gene_type:complete
MSKPLDESLNELKDTVDTHLEKVMNLMRIIQKLRADIDLAFGIMSPEQQELFLSTVKIADEQAKEIKDKYEEE